MKEGEEGLKGIERRTLLKGSAGLLGLSATGYLGSPAAARGADSAPANTVQSQKQPGVKESIKITRLETFLVKPRWKGGRRPALRPSRKWNRTWWAKTREPWLITGKLFTVMPSIAAGRS